MNVLAEYLEHKAIIKYDGTDTVQFRWHWPRGTFDRRMSALEIAAFIVPHMSAILSCNLFGGHPKIQTEWAALLERFVTWPAQVLDEVKPWVRRIDHNEADEILLLDLGAKEPPKDACLHFDLGGGGGG